MTTRWRISAGVVDAGLASAATFLIGIAAIRLLDPLSLGAYALVFAAVTLAAVVPAQLLFLPAEVAAIALPRPDRLRALRDSLVLGLLPALLPALAVSAWVVAMPPGVPDQVVRGLTMTAVICAFLSPIQDHVRKMLHIGGRSGAAALVSGVQFVSAAGAVGVLLYLRVPAWWIPLGSLAVANLVSLTAGVVAVRAQLMRPLAQRLALRELIRSGRWLLVKGLLSPGSALVAAVLVSQLAGAVALGYAEAARIIGRPVLVFTTGFAAVLGPRSVEAGQRREQAAAHRISRIYHVLVGSGAVVYFGLVGFDARWNPLAYLLPTAYTVTGLVAVTILATTANSTLFPQRSELLGGRREATLTWIELVCSVPRILIAATASVTASFAIPLGLLAQAAIRWVGYRGALRTMYREPAPVVITEPAAVALRAGTADPSLRSG